MNSTNKDNEFQIYEVDLTQKGNIKVTRYLGDSNTVDPLLEGSNVITAEVLDILRLLLDLRMLWNHTPQLDCLKETWARICFTTRWQCKAVSTPNHQKSFADFFRELLFRIYLWSESDRKIARTGLGHRMESWVKSKQQKYVRRVNLTLKIRGSVPVFKGVEQPALVEQIFWSLGSMPCVYIPSAPCSNL